MFCGGEKKGHASRHAVEKDDGGWELYSWSSGSVSSNPKPVWQKVMSAQIKTKLASKSYPENDA